MNPLDPLQRSGFHHNQPVMTASFCQFSDANTRLKGIATAFVLTPAEK